MRVECKSEKNQYGDFPKELSVNVSIAIYNYVI